MLRSTSIKIDSWKPVKLLARQSIKDEIVALSCDLKGNVAAIVSKSSLNIFTNRELLDSVPLKHGKQIHLSDNAERILVLTSDTLLCYDSWGQIKWTYDGVDTDSQFCVTADGNRIALSASNSLKFLSRFGEVTWDSTFEDKILKFAFAPSKSLVVSTISGLFLIKTGNEIVELNSKFVASAISCSSDYVIANSENTMIAFSYTGTELWKKEGIAVSDVSFSNDGVKHIFLMDSKILVCQDRNGDEIWTYRSKEKLQGAYVLESGNMIGVYSNSVFHIIDYQGQQAWSYQAREKIRGFSFSNHGGDVIVVSNSKIHWFQNEGFLRVSVDGELDKAEQLFHKVSVYDSNLDQIRYDIEKARSLKSGDFELVKDSFQIINTVNTRLASLHQRHVGYLDVLPFFMEQLGLQGAQTDEMIPLLYTYYSLHRDLNDTSSLGALLERASFLLTKLNRREPSPDAKVEKKDGGPNQSHFLKEAKHGISEEIITIEGLMTSSNKDVKSLESNVKDLVIEWLKTGELDSKPRDFVGIYQKSEQIREEKHELIVNKIENYMAFVDYSEKHEHLVLESLTFTCKDKVNLNLTLKNGSSVSINNLFFRIRIEGSGLNLAEPISGVIRLNHLEVNELYSPVFRFEPINRAFTRVVMVVQYSDDAGRGYTSWLGEVDTDFLGCYIKPFEIDEEEHGDLRLEHKDHTSHAAINIEGLTINKITNISRKLPGMHLCSFKEESSRSIIYHSAKSSLDDSDYLSMIFLRAIGGEESLRSALELVCHASDIEKSSELRDELMSYLKNKLLESNGRLV
ncbi:MAG: hypothetical protein NZ820_16320 [Dehalococcoidia bacterium]|nr:hypothetical protein [Dehalococcoidia bacterium]